MPKKPTFSSGHASPVPAAIALGANLGDPAATFAAACRRLSAAGLTAIRISRILASAPVDCPPGAPDYANAVLLGNWSGSHRALLQLLQQTEVALGRPALHGFHADRTLDLDLIWFGDAVIAEPDLTVPHPRALAREFVLAPLAELAGERRWPGRTFTVMEALEALRTGNPKN